MKKLAALIIGISMGSIHAQTQLIENGSFEQWEALRPENWLSNLNDQQVEGIFNKITNDASDGDISMEIISPASGNIAARYVDVPVIANHRYQLSFDYKDVSNNGSLRHWAQWRDANNTNIYVVNDPFQPDQFSEFNTEWTTVVAESIAPIDAVNLRFEFRAYNGGGAGGGRLSVDNLSIIDLDETMSKSRSDISQIKLYPNPTSGVLHIYPQNEGLKNIKIWSLEGRILLNEDTYENQINLENQNSGTYFIQINTAEGKYNTSILKM